MNTQTAPAANHIDPSIDMSSVGRDNSSSSFKVILGRLPPIDHNHAPWILALGVSAGVLLGWTIKRVI